MTDSNTDFKVKTLLIKLGYCFNETTPAAYAFALNLQKAGISRDRLIQLVTLTFPVKINF